MLIANVVYELVLFGRYCFHSWCLHAVITGLLMCVKLSVL